MHSRFLGWVLAHSLFILTLVVRIKLELIVCLLLISASIKSIAILTAIDLPVEFLELLFTSLHVLRFVDSRLFRNQSHLIEFFLACHAEVFQF